MGLRAASNRPAGTCGSELRNAIPSPDQAGAGGLHFLTSGAPTTTIAKRSTYYKVTRAGRKQLDKRSARWEQTTENLANGPGIPGRKGICMRRLRAGSYVWPDSFRKRPPRARTRRGGGKHLQMHMERQPRAGMQLRLKRADRRSSSWRASTD